MLGAQDLLVEFLIIDVLTAGNSNLSSGSSSARIMLKTVKISTLRRREAEPCGVGVCGGGVMPNQGAIDANSGPNAAMALRTAASSPPKS